MSDPTPPPGTQDACGMGDPCPDHGYCPGCIHAAPAAATIDPTPPPGTGRDLRAEILAVMDRERAAYEVLSFGYLADAIVAALHLDDLAAELERYKRAATRELERGVARIPPGQAADRTSAEESSDADEVETPRQWEPGASHRAELTKLHRELFRRDIHADGDSSAADLALSEIDRLTAELGRAQAERDEARTECASAHTLLDEQFTKLKSLGEQVAELEAELADWRATPPEALQSKTERDLRSSLSTLAEQNWRLIRNRGAAAAEEAARVTADRDRLRDELADAKAALRKISAGIDTSGAIDAADIADAIIRDRNERILRVSARGHDAIAAAVATARDEARVELDRLRALLDDTAATTTPSDEETQP